MNIGLNVLHSDVLPHRVDAPCKGLVAKMKAKETLESKFGLPVSFKSYQPSEGHPERDLGDDDNVQRGSVLNFTVNLPPLIRRVALLDKLMKGLYKRKVETLVCKYIGLGNEQTEFPPGNEQTEFLPGYLADELKKSAAKRVSLGLALQDVGCSKTADDFANALNDLYASRNERQHHNTKNVLRKEFKEMHDDGVHELLADEMPDACVIIAHFDRFLQLLP